MKKNIISDSGRNLAESLKVLSAETRLKIFELLKGRALCVNALSARLSMSQAAVSQHLRIMRSSGLVIAEKRGYFVHYRLNEKTCLELSGALSNLLKPQETKEGNVSCAREKKHVKNRKR